MKDITMADLQLGHEYYDENGIKFIHTGFSRKPIEIRHTGFVEFVSSREFDYVFLYETGLSIPEAFDPRRVFKEDIKEEFKFGKKCHDSSSNLVEE